MDQHDEMVRLLVGVLASGRQGSLPQRLCSRAHDLLDVDGLVVTVLSTPDHRHVVCATDDAAVDADDVQLTLGDGPVVEAFRDGEPVLVPDVMQEALDRWPLYGEATAGSPPYRAVFAFPLHADPASTIGVLALYRRRPGPLGRRTSDDARLVARAMALSLVRAPHEDDLDPDAEADLLAGRWSGSEQVVYQAVGMVVAQLRVTPFEALARLRAHAFAEGTTLDGVAMAVVTRQLRITR